MNDKKESSFTVVDKRRSGDDFDSTEPDNHLAEPAKDDPATTPADEAGTAKAPPINFSTFVMSIYSSAAYHMGGFQDPVSGKTSINLELAKQNIDILAMFDEKTKGNLDTDEEKLLQRTLYELRMSYVDANNSTTDGAS